MAPASRRVQDVLVAAMGPTKWDETIIALVYANVRIGVGGRGGEGGGGTRRGGGGGQWPSFLVCTRRGLFALAHPPRCHLRYVRQRRTISSMKENPPPRNISLAESQFDFFFSFGFVLATIQNGGLRATSTTRTLIPIQIQRHLDPIYQVDIDHSITNFGLSLLIPPSWIKSDFTR